MSTMAENMVPKKPRMKYTNEQVAQLERVFEDNHYPDSEIQEKLAMDLYVSMERVSIWFQNRRSKFKRQRQADHVAWMRKQIFQNENGHAHELPFGTPVLPVIPPGCHVLSPLESQISRGDMVQERQSHHKAFLSKFSPREVFNQTIHPAENYTNITLNTTPYYPNTRTSLVDTPASRYHRTNTRPSGEPWKPPTVPFSTPTLSSSGSPLRTQPVFTSCISSSESPLTSTLPLSTPTMTSSMSPLSTQSVTTLPFSISSMSSSESPLSAQSVVSPSPFPTAPEQQEFNSRLPFTLVDQNTLMSEPHHSPLATGSCSKTQYNSWHVPYIHQTQLTTTSSSGYNIEPFHCPTDLSGSDKPLLFSPSGQMFSSSDSDSDSPSKDKTLDYLTLWF